MPQLQHGPARQWNNSEAFEALLQMRVHEFARRAVLSLGRRADEETESGGKKSRPAGPSTANALGAYYRRVSFREGASVAVFATACKLVILIYRLLRWEQAYVDIGQKAYEDQYQARLLCSLATTATQLGYRLVKKTETVSA